MAGKTKTARDASQAIVSTPEDAAKLIRPHLRPEQETFVVLCVNIRNQPIGSPVVVAIGTVCGVEVHPRDVFREAIRQNAAGIVVSHNHPSGDPTPSVEDLLLTKRLVQAGELLGIPVLDHVIVTSSGHRSLAESNQECFAR